MSLTPFFLIGIAGGWVQLGPLGTAVNNSPTVPAPGDYDEGEIDGMICRGNRSTRRKPVPMPLCPPQTPQAARTRTRAAVVGSQRLTAWGTARPKSVPKLLIPSVLPTRYLVQILPDSLDGRLTHHKASTHTRKHTHTDISHILMGIWTNDSNVLEAQESTCVRTHSHRFRLKWILREQFYVFIYW
jgi:hypothetical protein